MFDQVYDRLNVKFPDGICGESFYNDKIPDVIKELTEKKLLTKEDNGAIAFFTGAKDALTTDKETKKPKEIPLILQKGDGGYGYDSTDMAAIKYRIKELKCNWLIYLTDAGQKQHFSCIFEGARKANWLNDEKENEIVKLDHVKFGLVLKPDGGKFKSRDGKTEKLVDLLDNAKNQMYNELKNRINDKTSTTSLKMEDAEMVASNLAYSAIKYADLRCNLEKNYTFDQQKFLSAEGDTAVYLNYQYARICSIFRKVKDNTNIDLDLIKKENEYIKLDPSRKNEYLLALHLNKYSDALINSTDQLKPHILCEYLYGLATITSKFLKEYRLLESIDGGITQNLDKQYGKSRLLLLHCVLLTMKDCFNILGFKPLERI